MDLSEFYETKRRPCLFSRATKDLIKEDTEKLEAAMAELEMLLLFLIGCKKET